MKKIKIILVFAIPFMMFSGCATLQRTGSETMTREEIIEMQLKQTLAIAETSLEVSRNAEKIAVEALEKSRQAEATGEKALETANKAVEAANEARRFAEAEVKKAVEAANEARRVAEQESEKAIAAANRASKLAMDHADSSAERAINAANEAIRTANSASERAIAAANQTIAEVNRLRATIEMMPPQEPVIMEEPQAKTTYTIRRGDTLSRIALNHYGDSSKWTLIYRHNRDVIANPENLIPGTRIVIP